MATWFVFVLLAAFGAGVIDAMAQNNVLQVLVFSLFAGVALSYAA